MRIRSEGLPQRYHEDHLCERNKFIESIQFCTQVNSDVSSFNNTGCKSSSGKAWEKLGENTGMAADESQKQERGDRGSKEQGQKSSFRVTGGYSELEPTFQKCKGRVVLRGDIVKDNSVSYVVFTEQGSSAPQMTAAKSHGHYFKTTGMRRTSSRCSIRLHPGQNGRCTVVVEHSKVRMSRHLDSSTTTQMA